MDWRESHQVELFAFTTVIRHRFWQFKKVPVKKVPENCSKSPLTKWRLFRYINRYKFKQEVRMKMLLVAIPIAIVATVSALLLGGRKTKLKEVRIKQ